MRTGKRRRRYWAPVAGAAVFCLVLFHLVLNIHLVSGASMAPSLLPGDVVLSLRVGPAPEYGDLVIIREPSGQEMVKRVAGVAGDTLDITPDGHVVRNGGLLEEPTAWYGGQDTAQWISFPLTVPEGSVFCLGDNRPLSLDSRHRAIGPIPVGEVVGRVFFVLRGT